MIFSSIGCLKWHETQNFYDSHLPLAPNFVKSDEIIVSKDVTLLFLLPYQGRSSVIGYVPICYYFVFVLYFSLFCLWFVIWLMVQSLVSNMNDILK